MGRLCGIVERFISNGSIPGGNRSDLYEIFDLLSVSETDGIIGVQCCGSDFAAHYRKITIEKKHNTFIWLKSGGKIELWGWRKLKMFRGAKRMTYKPRVKKITLDDLTL